MTNLKIWVLADNRMGTVNQAIALAQELKFGFELKNIEYNWAARLPNFLLKLKPIFLKHNILKDLEQQQQPDVIITAGRRTAVIAYFLKKKSNGRIKLIQLMQPNLPYDQFEAIILPEHDKPTPDSSNILRIIGALCDVQSKLSIAGQELTKNYPKLGKFIAVIIGGNTKNYNFTKENAVEFSYILAKISDNNSANLFISFSRRTPNLVKQIIKSHLPSSVIIYDPAKDIEMPNPYLGMLSQADYIISTADSISMCSEAASSGKPLYIFCPNNFKSYKHRSFIEQLVASDIAKMLDKSVISLEPYSYKPLLEVVKAAEFVMLKLNQQN